MTPYMIWPTTKDVLSYGLGLSHHELHLIVGVVLFLAFGVLWRRPLSSLIPLAPVALLEFANEIADYVGLSHFDLPWLWQDAVLDILLTLTLPLLIVARAKLYERGVLPEAGDADI